RELYDAGKAQNGDAEHFLRKEYELNARIANFPKPYIAIMDGIVMGGGVGVSVHASHRIVTERSRLAMPEVGIGFVPDVGGTWHLAKAPGETGTYLALTGESFGAADAIFTGFADFMIPTANLEALVEALATITSSGDVEDVLRRFAEPAKGGPLSALRDDIDRAFAHDDVEAIVTAL